MYWLDQHLLANKIKEEQKYKTVLLLLIIAKDENAHPEKAPASNYVRAGNYVSNYVYAPPKRAGKQFA